VQNRNQATMHTIRLKIHDKAYKDFMSIISKFSTDEIEIIHETEKFLRDKAALLDELSEMKEGKAKYHTLDELENSLEETIKKHENNL